METSEKKNWLKPEVEIISKDMIQSGSVVSYPEAVPTFSGLFVGAAS